MLYRDFQGLRLSGLGFGTMRLPLIPGTQEIDRAQVAEMVDYAIEHGVNYFDTAYPYHYGMSERVIGEALKPYARERFYLATKYPGHQISNSYDPAAIFEEQLVKCGVDYFDFYLLHNVYENSIKTYMDPQWGIVDYFVEQKRLGRIRHLGFSCHGSVEMMRTLLDAYGDVLEFCQIQLNYLDWTLQDGKGKYALLNEWNMPVWVMEPVRGGRLAKLPDADEEKLKALRPGASIASWCFRWLQGLPNVKMILSGMSNMEQMRDNVNTFAAEEPLTEEETQTLYAIAKGMYQFIPCTACRYCCEGCPMELDIPLLMSTYNDLRLAPAPSLTMRIEAWPEDKLPTACIGCGACAQVCPQHIDIPEVMREFSEKLHTIPKWEDICREREEEIKRLKT